VYLLTFMNSRIDIPKEGAVSHILLHLINCVETKIQINVTEETWDLNPRSPACACVKYLN
ncbi:hypothetical protein L9F63_002874, partial [Diploptera punctata]